MLHEECSEEYSEKKFMKRKNNVKKIDDQILKCKDTVQEVMVIGDK